MSKEKENKLRQIDIVEEYISNYNLEDDDKEKVDKVLSYFRKRIEES